MKKKDDVIETFNLLQTDENTKKVFEKRVGQIKIFAYISIIKIYGMNRKLLGETIVDNIIDSYRGSEDFKRDALRYIYKEVYDYYNAKMADCGEYFKESSFEEDGTLKPYVASEFVKTFGSLSDELRTFIKSYQKVFQYSPKYEDIHKK